MKIRVVLSVLFCSIVNLCVGVDTLQPILPRQSSVTEMAAYAAYAAQRGAPASTTMAQPSDCPTSPFKEDRKDCGVTSVLPTVNPSSWQREDAKPRCINAVSKL